MTTKTQIERYINRCQNSHNFNFLGCFSISRLPGYFPNRFPCSLIINDDKNHWVALVLQRRSYFYFDSMGRSSQSRISRRFFTDQRYSIDSRLRKWLNTRYARRVIKEDWGKSFIYREFITKPDCHCIISNVKQVQEYDTEDCAIFCVSFIKCVSSLKTYWEFLKSFDYENLKLNAYIAKKHLMNQHHKHQKPNCTICFSNANIVNTLDKGKLIKDQHQFFLQNFFN